LFFYAILWWYIIKFPCNFNKKRQRAEAIFFVIISFAAHDKVFFINKLFFIAIGIDFLFLMFLIVNLRSINMNKKFSGTVDQESEDLSQNPASLADPACWLFEF